MKLPKFKEIRLAIENHPLVKLVLDWSKTHSLPGFFKVPVYDVAVFLYNESRRVTIVSRANAMAFSFFLSLFPAIIFLFTLATHLPLYDTFESEINSYINQIMPSNAGQQLQESIKSLVKPNSNFLSIGFFLAIYFSSNGMLSLMGGFEKTHLRAFHRRPAWKKRLIAIFLTMQLAVMLAASVVLIILGNTVITWLFDFARISRFAVNVIEVFRWLVTIALFYFSIALIYRYGTALHNKLKWLTPGASLATILSIVTSLAFSFYVEAFNTYNKVYGSIGTIIVIMLWIQLNCFILLVGFELNASIAVNRDLKEAEEEED
ncbi:MAG: YihY/virulence factor BrkB family protein [Saprospiraceae bacterium]|jgi:membrane protein